MDDATYWTAVGSVGTAIGSFVALGGIAATISLYRKQRNEEHAAEIRETIRALVNSSGKLTRALRDGSPIVAAAWSARNLLAETLSSNADTTELSRLLIDEGVGLSAAIVGWERSTETSALREQIASLTDASRGLTGNLNVLSVAGDLLVAIASDIKVTFSRNLTDKQVLSFFLSKHHDVADLGRLLNALATYLHGNTALYIVARYEKALQSLDSLTNQLAMQLSNLDAEQLISVAKAKSAVTTETKTREMRGHVSALSSVFARETCEQLSSLIDQVERDISKEAASARLKDRSDSQIE